VIAGRRKTNVYACLIRPARACPLQRLAKWKCLRFPAATAQRIRFRMFELIPLDRGYAKDAPLPGKRFYRRRTFFKLLTPKFTEATQKQAFGENRPLSGKFSKFL